MLPFEMRTVLSEIHLFNDNLFRHGHHTYMKYKRRERVQDSRETKRERLCERQSMAEGGGSVSCKMGRRRNVMGEIRVGLKG